MKRAPTAREEVPLSADVQPSSVAPAVRALFAEVVDYAGLFPPAKLAMDAAVRAYAEARAGHHAWMLGRFVLPATQVDTFLAVLDVNSGAGAAAPASSSCSWPLSLLVSDAEAARRAAATLRDACGERVRVASFEVAPLDAASITATVAALREAELTRAAEVYFEVPAGAGRTACLETVARAGACAKVRSGGVTADAFPALDELRDFLLDCARLRLAFKATAGLHHACRAEYRLTYEPDSPRGVMHGFVNVMAAAALAWTGADARALDALLADARPTAWLTADALVWQACRLDTAALVACRQRFFRSFGSCSFDEPAGELAAARVA